MHRSRSRRGGCALPPAVRDIDPTNDTASADAVVAVNGPVDLTASITTGGTSAPGGNTVLNVTANNSGIGLAAPFTLQTTLPAGFAFTSGTSGAAACTAAGQVVSCPVAGLAPGATQPITVNATAPATAGDFTATVVVDPSNSIVESDETNNTASAVATVSGAFADLTTAITGPATAALNGKPTYVVTMRNIGGAAAGPNTLTVYLRGYDRIDSLVAPAGYVCTVRKNHPAGRFVDCSGSALAAGETVTLQVTGASVYSVGTWPVTATADSLGTVVELSETNTAVSNTIVS